MNMPPKQRGGLLLRNGRVNHSGHERSYGALMHPPQHLHRPLHLLDVNARPQALHDTLLHCGSAVQERLDELPVHEAERLLGRPDRVAERTILVERNVAGALREVCHAGLQAHEEVLLVRPDQAEQVEGSIDLRDMSAVRLRHGKKVGAAYRGHESAGNYDGAGGDGDVDGSDAIHHLAELDLARDFEPALVVRRNTVDVLTQHQEVAFGVAFEEGVLVDGSHRRAPARLKVAGDFGECVGFAFLARLVLEDRSAFH